MPAIIENDKVVGIQIDDYLVHFVGDEFLKEDADGNLYIVTDIYKLDPVSKEKVKVEESEVTPELESKINAWINSALEQAIEREKGHKPNE
jgi:hypothetical protein